MIHYNAQNSLSPHTVPNLMNSFSTLTHPVSLTSALILLSQLQVWILSGLCPNIMGISCLYYNIQNYWTNLIEIYYWVLQKKAISAKPNFTNSLSTGLLYMTWNTNLTNNCNFYLLLVCVNLITYSGKLYMHLSTDLTLWLEILVCISTIKV
jgi:hypothetical protein